jgi:hypothetical protein
MVLIFLIFKFEINCFLESSFVRVYKAFILCLLCFSSYESETTVMNNCQW